MTKRKLAKLRRELSALRARKFNLKTTDLVRFAGQLGRQQDSSRGKEPTYISSAFPNSNPLSIPGHRTINPYTANAILDSLEVDLDRWEDLLDTQEQKGKTDGKDDEKNPKELPPATLRTHRDPG
jgi:hypothetical protein